MKKLFSTLVFVLSAVILSCAAFADIAPIPREPVKSALTSWLTPVVLIVVIIAVVILARVFRNRKK